MNGEYEDCERRSQPRETLIVREPMSDQYSDNSARSKDAPTSVRSDRRRKIFEDGQRRADERKAV